MSPQPAMEMDPSVAYAVELVRRRDGRYLIGPRNFHPEIDPRLRSGGDLALRLMMRMIDYGLVVGRTVYEAERTMPGRIRITSNGPGRGLHLEMS